MDNKIKEQGEQFVLINILDAGERDTQEDTKVRAFNDRGEFEGFANYSTYFMLFLNVINIRLVKQKDELTFLFFND